MDIRKWIPDNHNSWELNHNCLYFKKYGSIPLVKEIDNEVYISLDRRCSNQVIKLILHFERIGIDYMFCDRNTISERHIYNENLEDLIKNSIMVLEEPKFFDLIKLNGYDYLSKLVKFINLYDCMDLFSQIHKKINDKFQRKSTNYWTGESYYDIKREDIRDYLNSLDREIKIQIFLT